MARLLVTGGTGYVGRGLVCRAAEAGWDVVGTSYSSGKGVSLDVRDAGAVERLLRELRPDAVVHTAYVQDGHDAWAVTVDGAEHVARAAAGIRLVHMSTDVVFDGRKGAPYVEEDEPSPVTDYGRAKAEAERRVAAAHPEALLVRTSLVYGGAEPSKHELAALERRHAFYSDEIRCPVHVADLAAALLELVTLDVSGPLHVAAADAVSRAEFAELIVRKPVATTTAPPGRPLDCTLDSRRAQRLMRTPLRGVRTVLRREKSTQTPGRSRAVGTGCRWTRGSPASTATGRWSRSGGRISSAQNDVTKRLTPSVTYAP
jgi:dTDP-4-dehydrorhamnose reductase